MMRFSNEPARQEQFNETDGDAGTAVQRAMNQRPRMGAVGLVSMAALMSLFNGCSILQKPAAAGSPDRAYTVYWPPAGDDHRLRLAVKDLIDMQGVVTTAGSGFFAKNNPPAAHDAKCLEIARERNVKIVGKTNLAEFALGVTGINGYFGTPRNRVAGKPKIIPGGSSSGSAVAVANGSADVAFGTDTGGSIRVPAACCGIAGLKTTFGLVSLKGVHPISPKYLDTVGPMAKDVPHLVQGMELLQRGFAEKYANATAAKPSARGIRIGRLYVDGTDPKIDRAVDDILAAKGFKVVVLDKTFQSQWEQAEKDGNAIACASGWLSDGQYFGKVSGLTKAVLALGAIEFSTGYPAAVKRRAAWQRTLRAAFKKVDFIALPTLKTLPPKVPRFGGSPALEALVLSKQGTVAVNFAGNPALALPIPVEDETVPVTSLQLVGPRLSEAQLLNAGRLIEAKQ
jgi:Asp-tRNA(Asn)/Glu-tRNA(Gln) amidotransferase A subunit family amidase